MKPAYLCCEQLLRLQSDESNSSFAGFSGKVNDHWSMPTSWKIACKLLLWRWTPKWQNRWSRLQPAHIRLTMNHFETLSSGVRKAEVLSVVGQIHHSTFPTVRASESPPWGSSHWRSTHWWSWSPDVPTLGVFLGFFRCLDLLRWGTRVQPGSCTIKKGCRILGPSSSSHLTLPLSSFTYTHTLIHTHNTTDTTDLHTFSPLL